MRTTIDGEAPFKMGEARQASYMAVLNEMGEERSKGNGVSAELWAVHNALLAERPTPEQLLEMVSIMAGRIGTQSNWSLEVAAEAAAVVLEVALKKASCTRNIIRDLRTVAQHVPADDTAGQESIARLTTRIEGGVL